MYTLIVNYFVSGELKTDVKCFETVYEAEERVSQMRELGIEITKAHYGIYTIDTHEVKQVA